MHEIRKLRELKAVDQEDLSRCKEQKDRAEKEHQHSMTKLNTRISEYEESIKTWTELIAQIEDLEAKRARN